MDILFLWKKLQHTYLVEWETVVLLLDAATHLTPEVCVPLAERAVREEPLFVAVGAGVAV